MPSIPNTADVKAVLMKLCQKITGVLVFLRHGVVKCLQHQQIQDAQNQTTKQFN